MFQAMLFMIGNVITFLIFHLLYKRYQVISEFADKLRYMKELYWQANIKSVEEIELKRAEYTKLIIDIREMIGKFEGVRIAIIAGFGFLFLINCGIFIWKLNEYWELAACMTLTILTFQIVWLAYFVIHLWSFIKKID